MTPLLDVWVLNSQYSASVLSLSYKHLIEYIVPYIYCVLFNHKNKPPLRKRHHNLWRHHTKTKVPRHDYVGGKTFLQLIWCNERIFNIKSNIELTIVKCFCFKILACVCVITASKRYTACLLCYAYVRPFFCDFYISLFIVDHFQLNLEYF